MAMSAKSRSWSDSGAPAPCTSANASDKLKPWWPGSTAWPKPGSSIGEILRACRGMGWTRAIRGRGQLTRVPVETRLGSGSETFRVADVLSRSLSGKARKRDRRCHAKQEHSSMCRSARVRLSRTPSSRGGSPSPPVRRPGSWTRPSSEDSSARTGEASRPRRRAQADCRRARHRERSRATDDVLEPPRVAGADFSKLRKAQKLETFDAPAPIFRTRLRQTAGVFKICAAADRARPHAGATTHGTRGPGFGATISRPVAIRAEARRLAERRGGCLPSSSARRSSYIGTRPIALRSEDEPRPDEPNPESRVGR